MPETPRFGPILHPFWPKNFKNKVILKESFLSILSFYAVLTLCKKSTKFHALNFIIPEKPHFGPLSAQKLQNKFILKNHLHQFKSLYCCNLMQNIRKVPCTELIIPQKTSFRPILGPFRAKNLKTSKQDFPKKVAHVNFKLTCSCNLGKKSEKF